VRVIRAQLQYSQHVEAAVESLSYECGGVLGRRRGMEEGNPYSLSCTHEEFSTHHGTAGVENFWCPTDFGKTP